MVHKIHPNRDKRGTTIPPNGDEKLPTGTRSTHTLHSTLNSSALCTPHFTHYALHSTLCASRAFQALHSPLPTSHSTLSHSTLRAPSALYTPHSALHTLHSTLCTLHFAFPKLHSRASTPHYTPHFTLCSLESILYTLQSPPNTPLTTTYNGRVAGQEFTRLL